MMMPDENVKGTKQKKNSKNDRFAIRRLPI
jgi:hypothetical protein